MSSKLQVIGGTRVLHQLNEDSTYNKLRSNIDQGFPATTKRQHVVNKVNVRNIVYTPYTNNHSLDVVAQVQTTGSDPHDVTIRFNNVNFVEPDTPGAVTVDGLQGNEASLLPCDLSKNTLRVKCTCLDFRFRFAAWNFDDQSLVGDKPPPYVRKTDTRPPVNPKRVPGVCKHIIAVIKKLQSQQLVK